MAWQPQDYIALVSVLASPLAALGGAWLNGHLARRQKLTEQGEALRRDMSAALGPMLGVLADANPSLVANAELREYGTPKEAIEGLYTRWTRAREALLVMHYGHPDEVVRELSFALQAEVEISLRLTGRMIEGEGNEDEAQSALSRAGATATKLGQRIRGPTPV